MWEAGTCGWQVDQTASDNLAIVVPYGAGCDSSPGPNLISPDELLVPPNPKTKGTAMDDEIYGHYDNEYSLYLGECCNSNVWANPDPKLCGCKGNGWWLSQVDSWHNCPFHGEGKPHPEDERVEPVTVAAVNYTPPTDADIPF